MKNQSTLILDIYLNLDKWKKPFNWNAVRNKCWTTLISSYTFTSLQSHPYSSSKPPVRHTLNIFLICFSTIRDSRFYLLFSQRRWVDLSSLPSPPQSKISRTVINSQYKQFPNSRVSISIRHAFHLSGSGM